MIALPVRRSLAIRAILIWKGLLLGKDCCSAVVVLFPRAVHSRQMLTQKAKRGGEQSLVYRLDAGLEYEEDMRLGRGFVTAGFSASVSWCGTEAKGKGQLKASYDEAVVSHLGHSFFFQAYYIKRHARFGIDLLVTSNVRSSVFSAVHTLFHDSNLKHEADGL